MQPMKSNVGKRVTIHTKDGVRRGRIEGEASQKQFNQTSKYLVLQLVRFDDNSELMLRFGYYTNGSGRWSWGRQAPLIPSEDFWVLVRQAQQNKW